MRRGLRETQRFTRVAAGAGHGFASVARALAAQPRRLAGLLLVTIAYHLPISATLSFMSKHLQDAHGYRPGQVALLFIGAGAVALVGNLVGGAATDRIGRRNGFALACITMAVAFAGFYLGPAWLAPWNWTVGLFAFLATHSIFMALAGEAFPTVARATAATLLLAVGTASSALGLFAEGLLYASFGNHAHAVSALLPMLLVAAATAWSALTETGGRDLEDLPSAADVSHADAPEQCRLSGEGVCYQQARPTWTR